MGRLGRCDGRRTYEQWPAGVEGDALAFPVGSRMTKTMMADDRVLHKQHASIMKTAAVHSRIQPEIKEKAEGILQRLGLSPTEAIRMFYTQIALRNGLPFDVAIPNDETVKALEDSRNGRNLERFDS
jgi:DNA-damage-inducible protein J